MLQSWLIGIVFLPTNNLSLYHFIAQVQTHQKKLQKYKQLLDSRKKTLAQHSKLLSKVQKACDNTEVRIPIPYQDMVIAWEDLIKATQPAIQAVQFLDLYQYHTHFIDNAIELDDNITALQIAYKNFSTASKKAQRAYRPVAEKVAQKTDKEMQDIDEDITALRNEISKMALESTPDTAVSRKFEDSVLKSLATTLNSDEVTEDHLKAIIVTGTDLEKAESLPI